MRVRNFRIQQIAAVSGAALLGIGLLAATPFLILAGATLLAAAAMFSRAQQETAQSAELVPVRQEIDDRDFRR